jgi:uncharacterized protein (TIGR04255 family)
VAERIIFPNAPITEALLDIRVTLPGDTTLEQLATFHEAVKEIYPTKRERIAWEGGFEIKEGYPRVFEPRGGPDGYMFSSSDGKQIVQARLDGFTFNRLKPYDRWETFRDQTLHLWQIYVQIAGPLRITRAALRYINRIEIPLPMRDFKDYIRTLPEIAPGLPQGLERYVMQLYIPVLEVPAMAIVTQRQDPVPEASTVVPLIFDIDVIHPHPLDVNSGEVWEIFEKLHDLKNDIFFKSITDKAKHLFQ